MYMYFHSKNVMQVCAKQVAPRQAKTHAPLLSEWQQQLHRSHINVHLCKETVFMLEQPTWLFLLI